MPVAADVIERLGLFDFSSARSLSRELGPGEVREQLADLILLNAAEFETVGRTLLAWLSADPSERAPFLWYDWLRFRPAWPERPLALPIHVTPPAAALALIATDCTPFYQHRSDPARLWDVAAFGGDMSKIDWLGGELGIEGVDELWTRFDDLLELLSVRYRELSGPIGFLAAQGFPLRGLLWKARLGALLEREDLRPALEETAVRLGLGEGLR
jgi:hypothetical protein